MENLCSFLARDDHRRVYVLDTNVLLHDPASIFRFEEHVVLIPMIALEEVDTKKETRFSASTPAKSVRSWKAS